jgi:hypothetical protein
VETSPAPSPFFGEKAQKIKWYNTKNDKRKNKMVKINLLTYLTFELNTLVDKGKGMPLKETRHLCENKTILR